MATCASYWTNIEFFLLLLLQKRLFILLKFCQQNSFGYYAFRKLNIVPACPCLSMYSWSDSSPIFVRAFEAFFDVSSDKQQQRHKLKRRIFLQTTRKQFFTVRVRSNWQKLPRDGASILEILRDFPEPCVRGPGWTCLRGRVEPNDLQKSLPTPDTDSLKQPLAFYWYQWLYIPKEHCSTTSLIKASKTYIFKTLNSLPQDQHTKE